MKCCSKANPGGQPRAHYRNFGSTILYRKSLSAHDSTEVFATELSLTQVWGPENRIWGADSFWIFSKVTIPLLRVHSFPNACHNFLPMSLFSNHRSRHFIQFLAKLTTYICHFCHHVSWTTFNLFCIINKFSVISNTNHLDKPSQIL